MFREIQYLNIYKQYAMFVGHPVPSARSSVQRPTSALSPFKDVTVESMIQHVPTSLIYTQIIYYLYSHFYFIVHTFWYSSLNCIT